MADRQEGAGFQRGAAILSAGIGVTGLVTGNGSLIKGSGQFPLYAYDGESAAFALPVAGSKQSLVIRHAEQSPGNGAPPEKAGGSLASDAQLAALREKLAGNA